MSSTHIERKPISFSKWKPTRQDVGIAYSYVNPQNGRRVSPGSDRWMRTKMHIATAAIHTGASEFFLHGGVSTRRWKRTVTITQEEADAWFVEAIARPSGFMLKAKYTNACKARERRLSA